MKLEQLLLLGGLGAAVYFLFIKEKEPEAEIMTARGDVLKVSPAGRAGGEVFSIEELTEFAERPAAGTNGRMTSWMPGGAI